MLFSICVLFVALQMHITVIYVAKIQTMPKNGLCYNDHQHIEFILNREFYPFIYSKASLAFWLEISVSLPLSICFMRVIA